MTTLRFRYQTLEFGDYDIHVRTLRDRQQFYDHHGIAEGLGISSATWPLFGIIWDSSQVLARLMSGYDIENKRILEVGCGIALSSLVLNHRRADITATDYHPEVEGFLLENTRLNQGQAIPFIRTDWLDTEDELGEFDLIIGSDLLYERDHAAQLSDFLARHSKPGCEVIIVDPGRSNHSRFSRCMVDLGYTHSQTQIQNLDYLAQPFRGHILNYQR